MRRVPGSGRLAAAVLVVVTNASNDASGRIGGPIVASRIGDQIAIGSGARENVVLVRLVAAAIDLRAELIERICLAQLIHRSVAGVQIGHVRRDAHAARVVPRARADAIACIGARLIR